MGQEPAAEPQGGQEPTPATEPKEGQEPQGAPQGEPATFDAEYVKTLRAEAAKHRKEAQEAKAKAEEYEERDKSELEKLSGKVSKAEQAKAEAESKLLRFEIAAEKQVPADAVDLLTGTTREELEAKADKILALAKNAAQQPEFDGGAREPASTETPEDAHVALLGQLLGVPTGQNLRSDEN